MKQRDRSGYMDRRRPMGPRPERLRLRTEDKRMQDSFERMRVPSSALRPLHGEPFHPTLFPLGEQCISFIKIQPPTFEPEVGFSHFTEKLIMNACVTTDLKDKSFPSTSIRTHLRELKTFFKTTPNFNAFYNCRLASIQQAGLVDLLAFQEETVFHLRSHLEEFNFITDDDRQHDMILASIDTLCQQVMFKLRGIISLHTGPDYQGAIVRQLCYLMAAGNREEDCGRMLNELSLDFGLGVLAAYCLIPMLFLRFREDKTMCLFIFKYLDLYRPGMIMGIFNQMLMGHRGYASNDSTFVSTVFQAVGVDTINRGLFFYPLPDSPPHV
ncbi:transcriptional control factor [Vombatid gammaherpesvirus 1]|uniref:Transcriptional control factor n=1 Tax=Vombatid gammaherpesvirus 1 TaxID=2052651 RepID=A0A3S5HA08_9GAMA|nr:transcriptional control factor [Vombatid gammaherpesvirus 1]AZB49155.1 transcriptional control factor [Vombatid gammaherpesvirus 1]